MDELIQENKDVDTLPFEDINQILQRSLRCCDLWVYKQPILDYISKKLGIPGVVTDEEVITITNPRNDYTLQIYLMVFMT